MAKLHIHDEVYDEYLKAYLWYAKRSQQAADKFRLLVHEAFERIASDPLNGAAYDAQHRYYRLKNYPHLVIYRYSPGDDTATVVAVSHPSQDQAFWQSR